MNVHEFLSRLGFVDNLTPESEIETNKIWKGKPVYRQYFEGVGSAANGPIELIGGGIVEELLHCPGSTIGRSGGLMHSGINYLNLVPDEFTVYKDAGGAVQYWSSGAFNDQPYGITLEYTKL